MFHFFGSMLGFAIAVGVSMFGYWQARQFTQNKLRFVDGVHKMGVPLLAGLGAALVATPIVWILPLVSTGTALLFGVGVALGVSAGAKEIRKRIGAG
jgi:Tfp pilus assembly protein PilZ